MTKQQITIEVDVPEGLEIDFVQTVIELDGDKKRQCLVVRFKDNWQWPSWLKAEWVAMDFDGTWWAFNEEPRLCFNFYAFKDQDDGMNLSKCSFLAFTPPPCTDWRQSKRRRPT